MTTMELVSSENTCGQSQPLERSEHVSCAICAKTFSDNIQLKKHYKEHKQEKPFKCEDCSEQFNVEANLRLHKAWLHLPIDGKPECPECGKTFARKASLRSHLLFHQKDECIRCMNCDDEFTSYLHYKKHVSLCPKSNIVQATKSNDRFLCLQCKQTFSTSSSLRDHTRLHFQLKCSLKQRFQRKEVDRTGFVHICEFCNKKFKKNSQLIRHVRIHTGEKPFICEVCGKSFTQKNSLDVHKTKHTGEKKYKCKFCDATFTQSGNMRAHIDRVHAPQALVPADQLFHCSFCPCVFRKIGSLNCHVSLRHSADNGPLSNTNSLKECESGHGISIYPSQRQDLLRKAMENSGVTYNTQAQNSEGIKTLVPITDSATGIRQPHIVRRVGKLSFHQCLYCPKEFKKSSDLVRHIRIHTHERPFKCDQCYRSFTVKSTLHVHLRTHTDLKEFKCDICCKMFASCQSLKVHKRIHLATTSFCCSICGKCFVTSSRLISHSKLHHTFLNSDSSKQRSEMELSLLPSINLKQPILLTTETHEEPNGPTNHLKSLNDVNTETNYKSVDNDKRNYLCIHCNKSFKKSSHLKQHTRSHTGEKPYQCSVCSQSFVSNGSLKIHLRTHSGEKPFKCVQCSFSFTTKGSLTRHITTHSVNRPFMCPYCHKTFKASMNCKKHIKLHKNKIVMELLKREKNESDKEETNSLVSQILTADNSMLQSNDCLLSPICENLSYVTVVEANIENDICIPVNSVYQMTSLALNEASEIEKLCPPLISSNSIDLNREQSNSKSCLKTSNEKVAYSPNSTPLLINRPGLKIISTPERFSGAKQTAKQSKQKDSASITTRETMKKLSTFEAKNKKSNECRSCEYCSKTFKKRSDLVRHTRIHTGEKPFVCKLCNKQFTVKSTLDSHIQTHKGERNFKCFICNSLFATKGSLNVHTRLHTGHRPFKCNVCNLSFRTSGHLKSHSQKHEKIKNCVTKENVAVDCYVDSENFVIVEQNNTDVSQLCNDVSLVPFMSVDNDVVDTFISQPTMQINLQIDSSQIIQQLQQTGVILAATTKDSLI